MQNGRRAKRLGGTGRSFMVMHGYHNYVGGGKGTEDPPKCLAMRGLLFSLILEMYGRPIYVKHIRASH